MEIMDNNKPIILERDSLKCVLDLGFRELLYVFANKSC